jgi:electron transfer flavoprotein beta subunit
VELGLQLAGDNLQVLHAGDRRRGVARLPGHGLEQLHVLEQPAGADALPVLTDVPARCRRPGGADRQPGRNRRRLGHVAVPAGRKLGWPLVVGLAQVESIDGGTAQVLQALPRGQRRRLKVRLPFLATVDNAAPKPRQSAYGPAARGAGGP